ncbi:lysine N(6)-hydroxylase/L-ornithine N(5)-oxygenase family protein [Streptomyces sp. C184]|uniref:lysine N(6)-hydroxylase/L-ornithine N(5)-oxygenase family protein n=1 Tax=Streptomyces sp. C184 TaxID=3237121 RepID=UPI0034C63F91
MADSVYDVVGIGFGPANLSLAIALEERGAEWMAAVFLEQQPSMGWHRGMLVPSAKMQVSFLKDLATFRNPHSRFSFVSYLHAVGRLVQFVNNQDFFPTRQEFHAYLEWAESQLAHRPQYNAEVTGIRLPEKRDSDFVEVEVRSRLPGGDDRLIRARNIVISTGLVPRMPAGVERDERVWHSSEFLTRFRTWDGGELKRIAVVGAGQSAAEIVRFLHDEVPGAHISAVLPSYGYSIADNTPFANQVFDPGAVDDYYGGSQQSKDALWQYHKNTNYSVVDDEVIKDLKRRVYDEELSGDRRLTFLRMTRLLGVKRVANDTRVSVYSLLADDFYDFEADLVVCATGYAPMDPARVLGELDRHCLRDEAGNYRVERDYRLVTGPVLRCGVYLQGGTEHTHGLTSSLLSNIAVRSGEIADSIAERRRAR